MGDVLAATPDAGAVAAAGPLERNISDRASTATSPIRAGSPRRIGTSPGPMVSAGALTAWTARFSRWWRRC